MSQTPKRWSLKGAVVRRVVGGRLRGLRRHDDIAERQRGRVDGSVSGSPSASAARAFDGHRLSGDRRGALRRRPVHRPAQEDHRGRPPDRRVPAVRPGRRVPAEDRVQRVRHPGLRLSRGARRRQVASSTSRTAPGPYKLKEWSKGNRMVWTAYDGYWGDQGPDAEPRVPLERPGRAAPARAPGRHRRRHRQPGHRRHRHDPGRHEPAVLPARGSEHLVPRLQQHDQAVGRRQGPPGDRHGHRPRADRQELLPGRLDGRRLLHAVRDPVRLRRRQDWTLRPGRGQGSS